MEPNVTLREAATPQLARWLTEDDDDRYVEILYAEFKGGYVFTYSGLYESLGWYGSSRTRPFKTLKQAQRYARRVPKGDADPEGIDEIDVYTDE